MQRDGLLVGKNRVARLMRHHGLRARVATIRYTIPAMKRFFADIPNRQHEHPASHPNEVWVGDITYLKVGAIYRYLAVVLDRCSRAVVGWSFGRRKDVALTLRALNRAVANRRPPPPGLVFHTDRGIESFFHSMKSETMHGYRLGSREPFIGRHGDWEGIWTVGFECNSEAGSQS